MDEPSDHSTRDEARPTIGARVVAFSLITLAGAAGGLIGWAVVDLQCEGSCATPNGIGALVGAVMGAGGVAVIAVLALQALAEWHAQEGRRRPSHGR
jgi:hypothetical protein